MDKTSSFKDKIEFNYSMVAQDTSTYWGWVKHFIEITNPVNFFVAPVTIERSQIKYESFWMREDIAKKLNSKIMIDPKEKEELIYAW